MAATLGWPPAPYHSSREAQGPWLAATPAYRQTEQHAQTPAAETRYMTLVLVTDYDRADDDDTMPVT